MNKIPLLILLIVLCCAAFLVAVQTEKNQIRSQSPYWWKVEMQITVSGKYSILQGASITAQLNGKYSLTTTILGTLQEDDSDYIFMQAFAETKTTGWKEAVKDSEDGQWNSHDLKGKIEPDVTLNYVFKNKGILSFDFDFQSMNLPLSNPGQFPGAPKLQFPESAGDISMKHKKGYKLGLLSGSNQVQLQEKLIYDKKFNNLNFQWTWLDKKTNWRNRHQVAVTLKIVRLRRSTK